MKSSNIKKISLALATTIALAGCKSLKLDKNAYTVTPNPLEMHGDSVKVAIKGKIPEKTFIPKAIVTLTPVIKTASGEKTLKTITFVGTKVKDAKGQVVDFKSGGSFTYNDVVAYTPDMKNCQLDAKLVGKVKSKSKEFVAPKIAEGTIITSTLVQNDEKPIIAKDNMPKTQPMNYSADIHFVVSQSVVRPTELKANDIKGMTDFLMKSQTEIKEGKKVVGTKQNYVLKGITISAYASPDGEQATNANLASDRAKATSKYLMDGFKKMKWENGSQESFYSLSSVAEDWEGFKELMSQSKIDDKEMILRILTTYPDLDIREREIRNISKTYTEISDQIMPKLRKSKITINAEKPPKTDEELSKWATAAPDSLTAEELLYAANLTQDLNTKLTIYNNLSRVHTNEWRGPNNAGYVLILQNKVNDAKAQFEKADKLKPNNPVVQNNLGVCAKLNGDKSKALEYYTKASGAGPEVNNNMANIQITKGDYAAAVNNYGSNNSFNAALAKLLSGDKEGALKTLEASKDASSANGQYLKAVIAARMGNNTVMLESLKNAIAKDASIKDRAKTDMEFFKFREALAGL